MSEEKESIALEIKNHPHCKVELTVTAFAPLIQKAKKEALKIVNKKVDVPGFRKGKAPEDFILKNYADSVQTHTKEKLAHQAFQDALKESKLPILHGEANIQYALKSFSEEKAVLSFQFEVEPSIPQVNATECKIKSPEEKKIGEKEVEEALKQFLLFYAKWIPITERGVEENDFVILDLITLEDPKETVFTGTRFEVTDQSMASWMKKTVLGAKTGDVLEGVSEADSHLSEKEKKEFQPKKVQITLKKVEKAEFPDLNEDFLKQVGVSSEEEFRKKLRDMLEKKEEERKEADIRDQINQFFLKIPFDLPLSLIEAEKTHRKKQFLENPKHQKQAEKMTQEEKLEVDQRFYEQAEKAVRLFYISRKIVQEAGIQVTHKEVEAEALRSLQAYGPLKIDPKKIPSEVFALALSKLILARSQDHIIKQNKKT